MVITMLQLSDMDAFTLGRKIKAQHPHLPVILLTPGSAPPQPCYLDRNGPPDIDRTFVWNGNNDLLLSLIKSAEDTINVEHDTQSAAIRVILFVEDSPAYLSALLPILYRELVLQTQSSMEEKLNEEHRLLTMRARPKILIAENFEEAVDLYERFEPYILGVISDMRFPRKCNLDPEAGLDFFTMVKRRRWDIPLLLTSSESSNAQKASTIPAAFVDKNSSSLLEEVRAFFVEQLGFGDFVCRMPDGRPIARANSMRRLEQLLSEIPDESFVRHCNRNDFSRWFFARSEIWLATHLRPIRDDDFAGNIDAHREYLIATFRKWRKRRQKGVVANFDAADFDPDTDFFKIGNGSLGGKARGLAFLAMLLQRNPDIHDHFPHIGIGVPKTLVITTEGFDSFIEQNNLKALAKADIDDNRIADAFLRGQFPQWLKDDLKAFLTKVHYPLAIRSSGLLEDAQFRAYAGLYRTYMITNDCTDLEVRLENLISAIKLVYASTYFKGPRAFSRRIGQRTEEEKMAVVIQQLVGKNHGEYFYPSISGVAQSRNYYPFSHMKAEEGIATIALGLGRMVVEGEQTMRFCPQHPQLLPERSSVDDILANSQRQFYALRTGNLCYLLDADEDSTLEKREVSDALNEVSVKLLCSTYIPAEHRIRDSLAPQGHRLLTFAHVLKYNQFPLAGILTEALAIGQEGMGCPVEIEFSVNLCPAKDCQPEFAFLQIRPMTARAELLEVDIAPADIDRAFCYSTNALGNAQNTDMTDIVYINPATFDPARTREIAAEIGKINAHLIQAGRKYLLIGPGRWGSADPWLGIPVEWTEISGVGAMVETMSTVLKAEPSQGSHFFHNITTLGINYITVDEHKGDFMNWDWLTALPIEHQSKFIAHVSLENALLLKVDGRKAKCVILASPGSTSA